MKPWRVVEAREVFGAGIIYKACVGIVRGGIDTGFLVGEAL